MPDIKTLEGIFEKYKNASGKEDQLEQVKYGDGVGIVLFTNEVETSFVHDLKKIAGMQTKVQCNKIGDHGNCILCNAKISRTERILLPVYDPLEISVKILNMALSLENKSLFPLVNRYLKNLERRPRTTLYITMAPDFAFSLDPIEFHGDESALLDTIEEFREKQTQGKIDFKSVIDTMDNERMGSFPIVQRKLKIFGYDS